MHKMGVKVKPALPLALENRIATAMAQIAINSTAEPAPTAAVVKRSEAQGTATPAKKSLSDLP